MEELRGEDAKYPHEVVLLGTTERLRWSRYVIEDCGCILMFEGFDNKIDIAHLKICNNEHRQRKLKGNNNDN